MIDELADIFREHIGGHLEVPAGTREEQLGHERQTISDYRGRVLVELFQNAIDRATGLVRIESSPGRLVVANDGDPVTGPISVYPLANVGADGRLDRSNFHSLCSISTSRKLACEAIGNKGIGFKSVFRTARSVEVWSRSPADQTWWGFRLVHGMNSEDAHAAAERSIAYAGGELSPSWQQLWLSVADSLKAGPAPSFYFPEPLPASSAPAECTDDVLTVVVLDLKPDNDIPQQLALFQTMPLHFVAARYPSKQGVRILVGHQERSIAFMASWDHFPPVPHTRADLVKAAAVEGLVFDEQRPPAIQLAFLPEDSKRAQGLFHCFFPTKAASGFCTDIHADFVVDQSRKGLDIEAGGYNAELLQSFPDLLVTAFVQRLHQRKDAWRFLTPGDGADPYLVKLVAKRLFGPNHATTPQWVALVRLAFDYWNDPIRGGAPWAFHQGFWRCVQSWWPVGLWGKYASLHAVLIGPLKAADPPIAIVPIIGSGHPSELTPEIVCPALPLPEAKLDDGRVILLRPDSETDRHTFRDVPRALADVIAITRQFPRDEAKFWADVRKFEWTDVVIASRRWLQGRAVAGATSDGAANKAGPRRRWGPDDRDYVDLLTQRMADLTPADRNELLSFWYGMLLDSPAEAALPAERLFAQSADRLTGLRIDDLKEDRAPRLRAEAALPLPVLGGGFLPACRVSASADSAVQAAAQATSGWGVLDRKALETLGFSEGAVAKLAQRLGLFKVVPLISAHGELGLHLPFEPEKLEPALWHPLLRAWMQGFEHEGTLPDGLSFAASLLNLPWFPVETQRYAPAEVWSVPDKDNVTYTLLPVVKERTGPSSLLGRLGIVALPPAAGGEAKLCDAKAAAALGALRAKCDQGPVSREARRLFSRLLRCLGVSGAPVPVLLGKVQDAHWAEPADAGQAWLATDTARPLRNYFPHLQFVDAFGSAELASRLGVRFFNPKRETDHDGTTPAADDIMREHLAAAMPYLLAVVDSQRLSGNEFGEVMGRWERAAVMRTDNVFLRLKLSEGHTEVIGLKDSAGLPILNEVFMPDNLTAWHDVPDLQANSEVWLPRFASWFADAVFNANQHTDRLRPILHALGEDACAGGTTRTDNYLKLFDIDVAQVDHWRKQFNEARMSSAQREEAVRERQEILQQFGNVKPEADLLAPTLTPAVFAAILRPEAQAKEVETALQAARTLPARFAAEATNRVRWNQAKEDLKDRVLAPHLLRKYDLASVHEDAVEKLLSAWEACNPPPAELHRLGFEPESFAQAQFPGRDPTDDEELQRAVHVLHRRPYATIESTAVTLRSLHAGGPGAAQSQSQTGRAATDAKKHERGRRAEEARAQEAARRVCKAPGGLRVALDAERSRIAAQLHGHSKGLQPIDWSQVDGGALESLVEALWIANHADCGYDVLDVDVDANLVLQVEVKSSGLSGGSAGLYLSATELKRARAASGRAGVKYRLEVYLGLSRRIDATAALEQALQRDAWLEQVLGGDVVLSPNEFYMEVQVGAEP